jgi:hypothetical protein
VNFTFTFIFTLAPKTLTQIFRGFLQSLQANSAFVVQVTPRPPPFTFRPSHNSLSSILSCWQRHLINNKIHTYHPPWYDQLHNIWLTRFLLLQYNWIHPPIIYLYFSPNSN